MITIITGAPGTGKTAALVSMLAGLGANRQLWVHGIPELQIPHEELLQPDAWHDVVPDGSVIIIDEVQTVWRPRGPGQKVPDHIAKLETHRHRGLDFYIITQGPNLIDSNVRALAGRHVHLRDLGMLGRWWYEWPECADNCRTSWKNAPLKKRYKLPKNIFDQYKSSSLHVKPIRSFPKMLVVALLALVATLVLGFMVYRSLAAKVAPPPVAVVVPGATGGPGSPVQQNSQVIRQAVAPDETKDFNPRIASRPWTAPAYDELRKVVAMPTITSAICVNDACKCYHNGRFLQVASEVCAEWAAEPPFDPYTAQLEAPGRQDVSSIKTAQLPPSM